MRIYAFFLALTLVLNTTGCVDTVIIPEADPSMVVSDAEVRARIIELHNQQVGPGKILGGQTIEMVTIHRLGAITYSTSTGISSVHWLYQGWSRHDRIGEARLYYRGVDDSGDIIEEWVRDADPNAHPDLFDPVEVQVLNAVDSDIDMYFTLTDPSEGYLTLQYEIGEKMQIQLPKTQGFYSGESGRAVSVPVQYAPGDPVTLDFKENYEHPSARVVLRWSLVNALTELQGLEADAAEVEAIIRGADGNHMYMNPVLLNGIADQYVKGIPFTPTEVSLTVSLYQGNRRTDTCTRYHFEDFNIEVTNGTTLHYPSGSFAVGSCKG